MVNVIHIFFYIGTHWHKTDMMRLRILQDCSLYNVCEFFLSELYMGFMLGGCICIVEWGREYSRKKNSNLFFNVYA